MDYVERINPGESIKIRTADCFYGQITKETQKYSDIDESKVNAATGPIYVEGASSGDLLKVDITKINVADQGVTLTIPDEGLLGDKVKKPTTRIIPIIGKQFKFGDKLLPIRPMIGVIGVAPAHGEGEWPTDLPWKHGGNMDTTDICEGSSLYLPINQEGALLAVGDCHATMGDGEVCVTGCEIAAEVTLKVDLIKGKGETMTWPLLETNNFTMIIASGDTLEIATYNAIEETIKHFQKSLMLSWDDAYILSSLIVDVKISQVVNGKKTVRAAIPKSLINTDSIISSI